MWPLWKLFQSWGHFMLDSWIRHLCLRCLWFLTMLENSVLGNKYQVFVRFSQGCGVFLCILKYPDALSRVHQRQLHIKVISNLPDHILKRPPSNCASDWRGAEKQRVEHVGTRARSVVETGGACTLDAALKCFHWTWEDDDDGTSQSRCEPWLRRLSATGHMSLFFLFALLVEASTASIDCTHPATSHLPVITVSLWAVATTLAQFPWRSVSFSDLISECIQKKEKTCVCG